MVQRRFVIIGDGAAGLSAAEELREHDPVASIGVFTEEPTPSYYRAALTNYLLGELREDQLWATSPDFYDALSIRRVFGRVVGIDTQRSLLWDTSSPTPTPYDRLLVASGGRPRPPSFDGAHLPGVLTLRTLQDARTIVEFLGFRRLTRAVVLGGGALGLEWAHALKERGIAVTLIEQAPRLLPQALDEVASDLLAARLRQGGIEVLLGEEVTQAHAGQDGLLRGVATRSGRFLECGLCAAALGVLPNTEFLKNSGLALSPRGALLADARMLTNVQNVWAAGDVASVQGSSLGLWAPAREQGRVAARNMRGETTDYAPGAHYFATRLFDLDFARIGAIERTEARETLVDFPRGTGTIAYRKLVLEGGRLVGALMIGERGARVRAAGRKYKRLIDTGADVSGIRDKILDPSFDFDGWLSRAVLKERPQRAPQATALVKEKKLRGTQLVKVGEGAAPLLAFTAAAAAGTSLLVRGTSVLRKAPDRTERVSLPSPSSTPSAPSSAPATLESPRGSTRLLSIGLRAEGAPPAPASLAPLDARLDGGGRTALIAGSVFSIGNGSDVSFPVGDTAAGGLHAQIVRQGEGLYLRDAGSRTGTYVNGRLLVGSHRLADGDRLGVGRTELTFRSAALAARAAVEAPAVSNDLQLRVRSGQSVGLSFALRGEGQLVGSAPGAAVELRDLSVAREHARIRRAGDEVFVTDLGSGRGTLVGGAPLPPGVEVRLPEGGWLRLGAVDLSLERGAVLAAAVLRPRARLRVDAGPGSGSSLGITDGALVGSGPEATFVLPGLAAAHVEVALGQGGYLARDRSGGASFKSGAPLPASFVPLSHGDLLLLGGGTMLRFEEVP
jgi:NADPH-dependent 2,4-dienoyl-CoA reductase/sulfur reductase-like enzyme/pSer/pThr/pTyr-binding forkhead associated (FHA) protein